MLREHCGGDTAGDAGVMSTLMTYLEEEVKEMVVVVVVVVV